MHPAYSVILFTAASGAGYGLASWLALAALLGLLPAQAWAGPIGFAVALAMIGVGFLSSTFHLGHPERAWRAVTQWRTSWLSREGVMAFVSLAVIASAGLVWLLDGQLAWWLAALVWLVSGVTVAVTAMIYASLKTIQRWHNRWVVPSYLVLALATGGGLALLITEVAGQGSALALPVAVVAVIACLVKLGYWRFIDETVAASTVATATGLGRPGEPVRLFEAPHTEENYLMREMGYRVARKHVARLRQVAAVGLAALPVPACLGAMLLDGVIGLGLAALTVGAMTIGVLAERWLFFAEARHTVTLYYGADRV